MGFWGISRQIFSCLCDNASQGVRRLALQTGLSKSSVHRLTQAIERRNSHPESWLWETEEGRQWLPRAISSQSARLAKAQVEGVDSAV